jgi:hypothetical protein
MAGTQARWNVLIESIGVEVRPVDVQAVVSANQRTTDRVLRGVKAGTYSMKTVKVYRWKRYQITTDEYGVSQRMATREAIAKKNCTPIPETEREVDASQVDAEGYLRE